MQILVISVQFTPLKYASQLKIANNIKTRFFKFLDRLRLSMLMPPKAHHHC